MFAESEHKYIRVEDAPQTGFDSSRQQSRGWHVPNRPPTANDSSAIWKVLTLGFAVLSIILATQLQLESHRSNNDVESFHTGFKTEIGIADRPPVNVILRRFVGTPRFDENGTGYQDLGGEQMRFAGLPKPEIDKAWNDLIGQRYFDITEHEAQEMFGSGYTEFKLASGKYIAGIEALHQLHCLNTLRKYVDFEYYAEELEEAHGYSRLHIDHCVDQIRQSLQCSGDLTPLPTKQYPVVGPFVVTDRTHTCRDFAPLRRWLAKKNAF